MGKDAADGQKRDNGGAASKEDLSVIVSPRPCPSHSFTGTVKVNVSDKEGASLGPERVPEIEGVGRLKSFSYTDFNNNSQ
jgi:hypothetical protein